MTNSVSIEDKLRRIKTINDAKATAEKYLQSLSLHDINTSTRAQVIFIDPATQRETAIMVPEPLVSCFFNDLKDHYEVYRQKLIQDATALMK